jgi:hypothetical protein
VLKPEHSSLQNFIKESSKKENKAKREREEKHAKDISDLAGKIKTSNQRIKTLVSKSKAYETEAENIDKMIFCKNFISSSSSAFLTAFIPAVIRKLTMPIIQQHVLDLNGRRNLRLPGLKRMRKRGILSMTSLRLVGELPNPCA